MEMPNLVSSDSKEIISKLLPFLSEADGQRPTNEAPSDVNTTLDVSTYLIKMRQAITGISAARC